MNLSVIFKRMAEESTNENTFDYTPTDTNRIATSDESSERSLSSTSTFSDTDVSLSSSDTSSDIDSTSSDQFSENISNESIKTAKIDRSSRVTKKLSRTKPPKIIVRRASNNTLTSSTSKNSSVTIDDNRLSPHIRKSKNKQKMKNNRNRNAIVS
jgi:hypothetical protein